MNIKAPILSTALGVVVRVAGKLAGFTSSTFALAKEAVAKAEATGQGGDAKLQFAIAFVLSRATGLPDYWALVLVQLAWLLFEHVGYPKTKA